VPLNGGILLSLAIGLPLSIIMIFAAPHIFAAMNDDPEVVRQGSVYLQWRLIAGFGGGINFSFRGYWGSVEQAHFCMDTWSGMHVLNVIFSYTLIYGLFGFPKMGTAGAGLGTTLAIFVGTSTYFFLGRKAADAQGFLHKRPTKEQFKSLVKLGLPSSVQQL